MASQKQLTSSDDDMLEISDEEFSSNSDSDTS